MSRDILSLGKVGLFFIDNEKSLLLLLKKLFSRLRYEVYAATDRNADETIFRENSDIIRLIIFDHYLTNHSGTQLLIKLKQIKPDIRNILTSSHTIDEELKKRDTSTIREYFLKPYNVEQMAKMDRKVLDA